MSFELNENHIWDCVQRGDVLGMKAVLKRSDVKDWINRKNYLLSLKGNSLLHEASHNGHLEVVQLLISSGADVKDTNKYRTTPLHEASRHGHKEVVQILLSAGADISCTDNVGCSPLHWVSWYGPLEMVKYLILSGADANSTNAHATTPLHYASTSGNLEIVKYLLLSGADMSCTDNDGNTPLHCASVYGHLEVVQYLLSSGADISCKDNRGNTVLDIAVNKRHLEVVDILLGAGAICPSYHRPTSVSSETDEIAAVIDKHLKWQHRKSLLMFLVTQGFLFTRHLDSGNVQGWPKTRSLSNPVHRVFMTADLQRIVVSYL